MSDRLWSVCCACLSLALIAAVGCSSGLPKQEPTLTVRGKLTNAGQPIPVPPNLAAQPAARPTLVFTRIGEGEQANFSASAITQPDGSFEAKIPKGKYRIAVRQTYAGPAEQQLLSKFDQRNSPIVREVTGDGQEMNIDLSKPEGP